MMNFQEAKTELVNEYTANGMTLVQETSDDATLQFGNAQITICREDIEEYARFRSVRDVPVSEPAECSIVSLSYREQIVQPLDPIRWWQLPPLESGFVFGQPGRDQPYAAIGKASRSFVNHFRFDPNYMEITIARMRYASGSISDMRKLLYYPPTVKVYNVSEKSVLDALQQSSQIISSCLFELASIKNIPVGLADSWPPRRRNGTEKKFQFHEPFKGTRLPLVTANYNTDAVQFFLLGQSSNMPVMQFQAYYKVLEQFFISASDAPLQQTMARRINDPRFRTTQAQLNRLIQDVIDHVQIIDKVFMIQSVLERYIDTEELCEFIAGYEEYLGATPYTRRRRLFGEDIQIKLTLEDVTDGISRLIQVVHDALTLSSDRGSRTARNVSFSDLTSAVQQELPIMKYLAEKVIIGSVE